MTICVALLFSGCDKKEPSSTESSANHGEHADQMTHDEHGEHHAGTGEMAMAESEDETVQTTCPVMEGNPIDKNLFVEYKGKKVYFCCNTCVELFNKDPEKYVSKLPQFKTDNTAAAAETAAEQTKCPVLGGPINKDVFVEYKGKKVYFCCEGCDKTFLADPEKHLAKLPQFGGKEE